MEDLVKMAPFRGRGRGRGQSRGRGGSFRGGRRGSRGGQPGGKLARSGIRTRAGYRKFDSQRVKDVDSDSEDGVPEAEEGVEEDGGGMSDDEEEEVVPKVKAYNALLSGFKQQQNGDQEGSRKRRKIEVSVPEDGADLDEESSVAGDDTLLDSSEGEGEDEDEDEDEDEVDAADAVEEINGDDAEDTSDPYEVHFASVDEDELSRRLKSIQSNAWRTEKQAVPGIGTFTMLTPQGVPDWTARQSHIRSSSDLPLKKRLADASAKRLKDLDQTQQAMAPCLFNYTDLLITNRTPSNASSLRSLASLHALNHVLRGRDKVLKNSDRISHAENPDLLDLRDQGFTRPKVLILTETRQMAYHYGVEMIELFQPDQVENKQRFQDAFSAPIDEHSNMPEDYHELFSGNNDNSFFTALKFTRKTIKFFSAFYASDIILASPLGLRRLIENEDRRKADHDFLSSIEVLIVDQADAMQMQSWENLAIVLQHLNLEPTDSHGADFNRVRSWYLNGQAKYLRQTIVLTAYLTPETNRLFNTWMLNCAGKAKLTSPYPGALISPAMAEMAGIKQTFSRFVSASPAADPDARFNYFTTAILPSLLRLPKPAEGQGGRGVLVFVPSYFDFIRVRNFFATSTLMQNTSFGAIHDYTSVPDQRRARSHFLSGRTGILLYTQRAHHFFRLRIRGVKRVVFYGLPDNGTFYEEIVGGFLGQSLREERCSVAEMGVRVCFGKWDGLALERVVGSERVRGLLGGNGDTFDFF
ncbi:rRNA-binding ribosome biosynthesis protein utp25 [Recurvomyces mirabilis]|uniref:rRNA-binding ribosome biosynthesis protein utp25 n=1 Tax=Recurvomyces mirabilis TaxID=574656 RepID=UPI002DDFC483|nr:rRNA-binding ribosome biosynthesis protein utp25 [Recurvomyces mirabilis]